MWCVSERSNQGSQSPRAQQTYPSQGLSATTFQSEGHSSFLPEASVAEPATGGEEEISRVAFLIRLQHSIMKFNTTFSTSA